MVVRIKASALRQSHWYEHALRFGLGGLVTVLAGVIADRWGPEIGGLFLAFPAIFCASSTMIEKHERQRKQRHHLNGERRATDAAALDAGGAALGSLGLISFALVVWFLAPHGGLLTLAVAAVVWLFVSVTIWRLQRALPRCGPRQQRRY
jgi:Protein of unknown function (DUF3147)